MKKIFIVILLIILFAGIILSYLFYKNTTRVYDNGSFPVKIEIRPGSSVSSIAKILQSEGVISSYFFFKLYYRFYYNNTALMSGEYLFDHPVTMREVIEKMKKGEVVLYKVTIKEGLTKEETAEFLERSNDFESSELLKETSHIKLISDLDPKADNLEGYLYPDTYFFSKGTDPKTVMKTMVNRFRENFTPSYRWRAKELGLSIREIVTLSSLIEKETASRDERFLISSVFHNRLRIGMPMGCDPTIIYALKLKNAYKGKLTWNDLKIDSPYNTRIHKGLPPGPICSPGIESIEAALFPEKTEYLYFVAKDRKTHYFSKTLKEHNWAVRKYIIKRGR